MNQAAKNFIPNQFQLSQIIANANMSNATFRLYQGGAKSGTFYIQNNTQVPGDFLNQISTG